MDGNPSSDKEMIEQVYLYRARGSMYLVSFADSKAGIERIAPMEHLSSECAEEFV